MRISHRASVGLLCLVSCLGFGQASSRAKTTKTASSPDSGSLSNGVYRNSFFSFSSKVPFGWVDRTSEMQSGNEPGKSWVLLAVFEHPPEASTDAINSGIVIAAESLSVYPGMKSPVQYFHLLDEVTTGKGLTRQGDPYEQAIGAHTLVRGDFSKQIGSQTLHQASLAWLSKGYALSFTFIGGSEDGVNDLVKGFSLTSAKAAK
jgi:hypothetical protein